MATLDNTQTSTAKPANQRNVISRFTRWFFYRACGALVAEGYRDGGLDRAALLERLAGDIRGGPPLTRGILVCQVQVEGDGVAAGGDYDLEAPGAAPRRLRARYRLVEEQGSWRIAGGL